jgi:hypothetical protein
MSNTRDRSRVPPEERDSIEVFNYSPFTPYKRDLSKPDKCGPLDLNTLWVLARIGCTRREMAAHLQMPESELWRLERIYPRMTETIQNGQECLKISLRRWQLKAARKGNIQMLIWLGKQLLQQTDKAEIKHLHASEESFFANLNPSNLTEGELKEFQALLGKMSLPPKVDELPPLTVDATFEAVEDSQLLLKAPKEKGDE